MILTLLVLPPFQAPAAADQTSGRNVAISTFKPKRLGGKGSSLVRLIPVFLAANLTRVGVPVVALQTSQAVYLEHLMALAGMSYSESSPRIQVQAADAVVEGEFEYLPDRSIALEWRVIDLTSPTFGKFNAPSSTAKVSLSVPTDFSQSILARGSARKTVRPSLPASPKVAVGGFFVDEHLPVQMSWMMEDYTLASILDLPDVRAVERSKIREIENELKLSLSGAVDPGRMVVLGRLTQADLVVYGAAARDTDGYSFAVLIADVWTGLVLRAATGTAGSSSELVSWTAAAVRRLLTEETGGQAARNESASGREFEAAYALYRAAYFFERSQLFPEEAELTAALDGIDRALTLNSEDAAARYLRGKILLKMKRFEEATAEFLTIVKKYPTGVWAGEAHKELGDRHFYWYADHTPQPQTGMSMSRHYMTSAIDFPNSFGAWESTIKLAQIYSGKEIPDTVFVPVYEKLIAAHPDHRNIVLYQWAGRYLHDDYAKNWNRVQPLFARMDPKGWWHQFRVLRIWDRDEGDLPPAVQKQYDERAIQAFDQTDELEGKLLMTTCLEDDQFLHGKPVIELRKDLAAQILERSRRLVDLTLAAPDLSNEEKAAVLYNATRKMVLITFSYSRRFEHIEAISTIGRAILQHFPDVSPYPMYVIHDLLECCYEAEDHHAVMEILNMIRDYVLGRPRLPGRAEILERLFKLHMRERMWNRAEEVLAVYEQMKDRNEEILSELREMLKDKSGHAGSWAPSRLSQGRDFLVRFARPAFNFAVK